MPTRTIRLADQHNSTTLPDVYRTREDLRQIYGPRYSRLAYALQGRLIARPTPDDTRPAFSVRATPKTDSLEVAMGQVSRADHAAGWAVLQLYQNKRDIFLNELYAMDSDRNAGGMAYLRAKSATDPVYVWPAGPYKQESGIAIHNTGMQTLLAMLDALKEEYDGLLPHYDNGGNIGGIVGAGNFDDFCGAWDEAWSRETPVAAARTLLESGVFISEPTN